MKKSILASALVLSFLPAGLFAQEASEGSGFQMLIGIALIFGIFYFLIIRPQSKRAKQHAELVSTLEKGDQVMTQSGLYGKIHGLAERVVTLEVAPNVRVRVDRSSIASKDKTEQSAA